MTRKTHLRYLALVAALTALPVVVAPTPVFAQDAPAAAPAGEVLSGEITGVRGRVKVQLAEGGDWKPAEVGTKVTEGATFRTGLRSSVAITLPGNQVFQIDRMGEASLLEAFENADGELKTTLGMKYGRTRYNIKTDQEHETRIVSPSANLAVRGSDGGMQEGAAFGWAAWSNESVVRMYDNVGQKAVTMGDGSSSSESSDPGETAKKESTSEGAESGSLSSEEQQLAGDFQDGSFALQDQGLNAGTLGDIGTDATEQVGIDANNQFLEGTAVFKLTWDTAADSDLDFILLSPAGVDQGLVLATYTGSAPNAVTQLPSGGFASADDFDEGDEFNSGDMGMESFTFNNATPAGTYVIGVIPFSYGDNSQINFTVEATFTPTDPMQSPIMETTNGTLTAGVDPEGVPVTNTFTLTAPEPDPPVDQ